MKNLEYHIVNGDCLKDFLPQDENLFVFREALIEGDSVYDKNQLEEFFHKRALYFNALFPDENYETKVLLEFRKMQEIPNNATVYFWFGNDEFCLKNLKFLLDVFQNKKWKKMRVLPENKSCEDFFQEINFKENSSVIA